MNIFCNKCSPWILLQSFVVMFNFPRCDVNVRSTVFVHEQEANTLSLKTKKLVENHESKIKTSVFVYVSECE